MAVAVLMYHDTPDWDPDDQFGVRFDRFRDQILTLRDAGLPFIPFAQAHWPAHLQSGNHVAVTLDDGNGSNAKAVAFLADQKIRATIFAVSQWAETGVGHGGKGGYLSPNALRDLSDICEIGGHGASHSALSWLDDQVLDAELRESFSFVSEVKGSAAAEMSFPGGAMSPSAIAAAREVGFSHIGNSVFENNRAVAPTINRLVVQSQDSARDVLNLVQRSGLMWNAIHLARRAKGLIRR